MNKLRFNVHVIVAGLLSAVIVLSTALMDFFEVDLSETERNTPLSILSVFGMESYTNWGNNNHNELHIIMMLYGVIVIVTTVIALVCAFKRAYCVFCFVTCANYVFILLFYRTMARNVYIINLQKGYVFCAIACMLLSIWSIYLWLKDISKEKKERTND